MNVTSADDEENFPRKTAFSVIPKKRKSFSMLISLERPD